MGNDNKSSDNFTIFIEKANKKQKVIEEEELQDIDVDVEFGDAFDNILKEGGLKFNGKRKCFMGKQLNNNVQVDFQYFTHFSIITKWIPLT